MQLVVFNTTHTPGQRPGATSATACCPIKQRIMEWSHRSANLVAPGH